MKRWSFASAASRMAVLAAVLFLMQGMAFCADVPTIKAKVGEPVLQELMGGCCLACAFPWDTKMLVPGKAPKAVYKLNDSDASTAWVDPNMGIGTTLVFSFPAIPSVMDGNTPFYGFDLASGYSMSDAQTANFSRVKKAEIFYNEKPLYYVTFADTKRWQHVNFDDIFPHKGDRFALQIVEVYPGKKFPNVAITQLVLQGAH